MTVLSRSERGRHLSRLFSLARSLPAFVRIRLIGMLSILSTIVAAGVITTQIGSQPARKIEVIPLKECYSIMERPEMKRVRQDFQKPDELSAPNLSQMLGKVGASNIFIVAETDKRFDNTPKRGVDDSSGFIRFTDRVLNWGRSPDNPFEDSAGPYWLFVHFGVSYSSPPRWIVESITRDDKLIVVKVKCEKQHEFSSTDSRAYFLWAPLGELPPAPYDLRVIDSNTGKLWFSRSLRVD